MNLPEVNRVRHRALGLLAACFIILVLGYLEAAWIDYYFAPYIMATPRKVYLLYRRDPAFGENAASYIRESSDGITWSEACDMPFDPGAAQIVGDEFLVVRGRHFSIYSFASGTSVENARWRSSVSFDFDWKVGIALAGKENLRLVGFEDAKENMVRIHEAIILGGEVRELPFSLEIERPESLAACLLGDDLYVVCRKPGEQTTNIFRRKAQGKWESPAELPGSLVRFDCAGAAGAVHIVGTLVHQGASGDWRLTHYVLSPDGSVDERRELRHNLKTFYGTPRRVSEISLASAPDKLYLALRCGSVIAVSVWSGGAWGKFVTVSEMPFATKAVLWGWLLSVLALCGALVVTGFQLHLTKRRKVAAQVPVPHAAEPAAVASRLGAFVIDLAAVGSIIFVVGWPGAGKWNNRSVLDLVHFHHPLILKMILLAYFALPEALFGQTMGKHVLGIVVMSRDGKRVGVWAAVLRNLSRLLWFLSLRAIIWPVLLIEVVVFLSTEKSQRLGDIIADTVVVKKGSVPKATIV